MVENTREPLELKADQTSFGSNDVCSRMSVDTTSLEVVPQHLYGVRSRLWPGHSKGWIFLFLKSLCGGFCVWSDWPAALLHFHYTSAGGQSPWYYPEGYFAKHGNSISTCWLKVVQTLRQWNKQSWCSIHRTSPLASGFCTGKLFLHHTCHWVMLPDNGTFVPTVHKTFLPVALQNTKALCTLWGNEWKYRYGVIIT